MSDSEIIMKYLITAYPNKHQIIYLYASGTTRSCNTAIKRLVDDTRILFCPSISENLLNQVIKVFLENKKNLFMRGLIEINSVY